jgi:hypothetical protein
MTARTLALTVTTCYALPTALVLANVWYHTKGQNHGMDWMGVGLLTFPGCVAPLLFPHGDRLPNSWAILIGLILNSSAIYLLVRLYRHWADRLETVESPVEPGTRI